MQTLHWLAEAFSHSLLVIDKRIDFFGTCWALLEKWHFDGTCIGPKIYYWEIFSFFKDREQQRGGRDNNAGKLSTFEKHVLFKNLVQPSNMAHAMKGENCQKIIKIHLMYYISQYSEKPYFSNPVHDARSSRAWVCVECGRPWDGAERQLVAQGPLKRTQVTRNSWLQEPKHEVTHDHKTSRWTDW